MEKVGPIRVRDTQFSHAYILISVKKCNLYLEGVITKSQTWLCISSTKGQIAVKKPF